MTNCLKVQVDEMVMESKELVRGRIRTEQGIDRATLDQIEANWLACPSDYRDYWEAEFIRGWPAYVDRASLYLRTIKDNWS